MAARILVTVAAAAALVACAKSQPENSTPEMADKPAHVGAKVPYVEAGWKPGDPQSWEEQMRRRVQNQNEYTRVK